MKSLIDNLEVKEFSLKQILENLKQIPSNGRGRGFGNDDPKMTAQEKRNLMEKVRRFNDYGKVLRCETAIMELSKTMAEIGQLTETYLMSEVQDYFQAETVQRDCKEMKNIGKQFQEKAKECYSNLMELNALYEDSGLKLERYFEIESLDQLDNNTARTEDEPSKPAPNSRSPSVRASIVDEISDEEEECGMMDEGSSTKKN